MKKLNLNFQSFEEVLNRFGPFEINPTIAIATSGGIDSICLAILANEFVKKHEGQAIALTVNHNLRTSSSKEAKETAKIMHKHNIEHHILNWEHQLTHHSNIESKARDARYELLTNFCKKHKILHLLVGHHKNDVAENFLIRLERGSSVEGLSKMKSLTSFNDIQIMRPLLNFEKSDIIKFANEIYSEKIESIEDPSNCDESFVRNRIRKSLNFNQLTTDRIVNMTENFTRANDVIIDELENFFTRNVEISEMGFGRIFNIDKIKHDEIKFRAIAKTLQIISGKTYKPRFKSLKKILDDNKNKTLSDCQIISKKDHLLIIKEQTSEAQILKKGTQFWDNRWLIENQEIVTISYLSEKNYHKLSNILDKSIMDNLDKRILFTLPLLKNEQGDLIIPHLNHNKLPNLKISFKPQWQTSKIRTHHND